jgi:putative transcriptional regulator
VETRIRVLREGKGLTQEQLADLVDVTRQTILFLEKGKYNPSLRLAWKIAEVFDRPIEEVFSFDDERQGGES